MPIEEKIYRIRGRQVMLASDLARLYGIQTKRLNEQVRRNIQRFPQDFMFRLTLQEMKVVSRSQFATLKQGHNMKYLPYVFTDLGVAMLSSVLNSERAIQVNIAIMRAFVKLRHALSVRRDITAKVEHMEGRLHLVETDVRFLREDLREKKETFGKPPAQIKGFEKE